METFHLFVWYKKKIIIKSVLNDNPFAITSYRISLKAQKKKKKNISLCKKLTVEYEIVFTNLPNCYNSSELSLRLL